MLYFRNARNTFYKLSFLEMNIKICGLFQKTKDQNKFMITIPKGDFGNKLCKNYAL